MKHSPKGGIIGKNGEFYEGGKFLPTTTNAKGTKQPQKKATGKQEIEPYVWAIAPENNMVSIFKQLAGVWGQYNQTNKTFIKSANFDTTAVYYKLDETEINRLIELINKYNNGERWINQNFVKEGN